MSQGLPQTISCLILSLFLSLTSSDLQAQSSKHWTIEPIIGLQLWTLYSTGQEVYHDQTNSYQPVGDRFNMQFRRSRLGAKGQFVPELKYNITASLDFVGRDVYGSTYAGANNGGSPSFRIWNAFVVWQVLNEKDLLHVKFGYQIPQIGRESMTGALLVTSMEKAWEQNYLRRHLVGTGPGRAVGLNLGGFLTSSPKSIRLSYDVGIFNPLFAAQGGNSTGTDFSLLFVPRLVLHLGDPEFDRYSSSHIVNYFGKRKGISIAGVVAHQGQTDLFSSNSAYGFDVLANHQSLNIDGEYIWMRRENDGVVKNQTGYLRFSYNFFLENNRMIEPVFMASWFKGALSKEDQRISAESGSDAGEDRMIDLGINYYFSPKTKLTFHYTFHKGEAGSAEPGTALNNYFSQPGVGAIKRGNWIGLGLVVGL